MSKIVLNSTINEPVVLTIGFFDGLHLGHFFLINDVNSWAREKAGVKSAILTFDRHPRAVLKQDYKPSLITTLEEKVWLFEHNCESDYCIIENFAEIAGYSAYEFMKYLKKRYNVVGMVVGYDHRFGHNRTETFEDYARYGNELGIEVRQLGVSPNDDNLNISSTIIRKELEQGNIREANKYLGHPYFLFGTITEGYKLGRTIGFPTANVKIYEEGKLIPEDGVYAVKMLVKGKWERGMLYIGNRPTVNTGLKSIEVNLFDFEEDIYGEKVMIEFVDRTRGSMKFADVSELQSQLKKDSEEVKQILHGA